jgi:heme/copper-type cytochrome/quinol oxidase subunit 2
MTIMADPKQKPLPALFTKDNYTWMVIGAVIIALGMILMSGGKNQDPGTFDYNVVYSTTRITIAPILIVAGLLVEVFAIFKSPKQSSNKL